MITFGALDSNRLQACSAVVHALNTFLYFAGSGLGDSECFLLWDLLHRAPDTWLWYEVMRPFLDQAFPRICSARRRLGMSLATSVSVC